MCCTDSPGSQGRLFQLCSELQIAVLQEITKKSGTRGKSSGAPLQWHAKKGSNVSRRGLEVHWGLINLPWCLEELETLRPHTVYHCKRLLC